MKQKQTKNIYYTHRYMKKKKKKKGATNEPASKLFGVSLRNELKDITMILPPIPMYIMCIRCEEEQKKNILI